MGRGVRDGDKFGSSNQFSRFINEKVENEFINLNTIIPATVISYDEIKNRAVVKPLFKILFRNHVGQDRDPIRDVPVAHFGSKNNTSFYSKLEPNDTGIILVAQRSIDEMKVQIDNNKSFESYLPKQKRRHHMSDCIFLPISFRDVKNGIVGNKDSIAFENEVTSLREILQEHNDQLRELWSEISSLRTELNSLATISSGVPPWGPALFGPWLTRFTTSSATFGASLVENRTKLIILEDKLKSLLKEKGRAIVNSIRNLF